MKTSFFILTLTTFIIPVIALGYDGIDTAGKPGRVTAILEGIKTEQANKATAESSVSAAQGNLDAQKPALEKERDKSYAEAQRLYEKYNNKFPEGSAELANARQAVAAANAAGDSYQDQINVLQEAVNGAQKQLDEADAALKDWQQQLQSIGNLNGADWDCFFDGKCGEYGATPERGKGFRIYPNGPVQGAPPIFTPLSDDYIKRHNPDNRPVPKLDVDPPQKTYMQQAKDKVKQIYNDIIKRAQQYKARRVATAVLAVRG